MWIAQVNKCAKRMNCFRSKAKQDDVVGPVDLGIVGTEVGHYSIEHQGALYDLNDFFSRPLIINDDWLVRAPVEALINSIGLLFACMGNWNDWFVQLMKLLHFLFHIMIHLFPEWSPEEGFDHQKSIRTASGIISGIARYLVLFVYAWRISMPVFVITIVIFTVTATLKTLGELIKTTWAYFIITAWMCANAIEGDLPWVTLAGVMFQMIGSAGFYFHGQIFGHYYKPTFRTDDRKLVPYHIVSDTGNVLFLNSASV